jgi:DNA-binding response OmpR family regulator
LGETSAIPVVVLSRQQDPVEIINSTLRNAGRVVHCTWVRDLADLADALGAANAPQLLFFCVSDSDELESAMEQRSRLASRVPALVVRDSLTEADLVRGLELGAADVVTLGARGRLQSVAARVLAARGHRVTLFERSPSLGGFSFCCGGPGMSRRMFYSPMRSGVEPPLCTRPARFQASNRTRIQVPR